MVESVEQFFERLRKQEKKRHKKAVARTRDHLEATFSCNCVAGGSCTDYLAEAEEIVRMVKGSLTGIEVVKR
jgi:hypothetical protein